jgi:cell wall-associated NlpC family hydrolase
VTYAQADVGTEVTRPWNTNVAPGDLLLMPGDDNGVTTPLGHIGMAIGGGLMIQAPYTGTVVQIDPIPWADVELVRRVIS